MAGVEDDAVELQRVVTGLLKSLSIRLRLPIQEGLTGAFITALARKLGLKTGESVAFPALLARMKEFGLDLDHIEVERLDEGDLLHRYFILDLANVLLDSIDHVKKARATKIFESRMNDAMGSSGGEEVSRILEQARAKYGRIRSIREAFNDRGPPPVNMALDLSPIHRQDGKKSDSLSNSSEVKDTTDHILDLDTKAPPKPKRRKMSKDLKKSRKEKSIEKENVSVEDPEDDENDQEINVNIPVSDTTDVMIKVKPLDDKEDKNQRIHVRINRKSMNETEKSKSKHIVYGSKGVVSHHLRKTRPPMFSRRQTTPRLDRKQVIERVFNEVKKQREQDEKKKETDKSDEINFNIKAQKLLNDKRTKNAQFKKLMNKL